MRLYCLLLFFLIESLTAVSSVFSKEPEPFWWQTAVKEAREEGYALMTPEAVISRLQSDHDCLLVDVRPDYEFRSGHIPGAVNLVFDPGDRLQLAPDKQQRFEALLGPDKNRCIIIHCRDFR